MYTRFQIYDDFHDFRDDPYRMSGDEEPDVIEDYESKWPPGYWDQYAELQKTAIKRSGAIYLNMVVKLNNRYQVRAQTATGRVLGPEKMDRHEAWQGFIDLFPAITPKGNIKLGSANRNGDAIIDGDKLRKELKKLGGSLDAKFAAPKKGRKR